MDALAKTLSPARVDIHHKRVQRMLQQNSLLWWELQALSRGLVAPSKNSSSSRSQSRSHPYDSAVHRDQNYPPRWPTADAVDYRESDRPNSSHVDQDDHTKEGTGAGAGGVEPDFELVISKYPSATQPPSPISTPPPTQQTFDTPMSKRYGDEPSQEETITNLTIAVDMIQKPRRTDTQHTHLRTDPGTTVAASATSSSSSSTHPGSSGGAQPSSSTHTDPNSTNGNNVDPNRKRRGNLPKSVTSVLKSWLVQNAIHPYPTEEEKMRLSEATQLSMNQISNWFINARRRILQPILHEAAAAAVAGTDAPVENVLIVRKVGHGPNHGHPHPHNESESNEESVSLAPVKSASHSISPQPQPHNQSHPQPILSS
ncbi:hypothetical protein EC957_011863 [Mortierella hygrophila]|uniref:Homeobox domain-containing protein n=1 Tax=Mortierella hygrophila TaxID=979708 RepID=A0A9P6F805_9FUNG|nr:hypothetical protein EC957_011863 [Mortierella hygrophila]